MNYSSQSQGEDEVERQIRQKSQIKKYIVIISLIIFGLTYLAFRTNGLDLQTDFSKQEQVWVLFYIDTLTVCAVMGLLQNLGSLFELTQFARIMSNIWFAFVCLLGAAALYHLYHVGDDFFGPESGQPEHYYLHILCQYLQYGLIIWSALALGLIIFAWA